MENFTAHRLRFVTEAQGVIELNEHQGSAIRGSLFHALRNRFCGNRQARECDSCPLVATCPVAALVSTMNPQGTRGQNVPRPYTIQPPAADGGGAGHPTALPDGRVVFRYRPGERFEFGLTLYAQALQLFPYVVLVVQEFERSGIGRRTRQADGRWQRGTLRVCEVRAENPLTGERQLVMRADDRMVQMPDVPITHHQVDEWVNGQMADGRVTVRFWTPTRLVVRKRLVKPDQFRFQVLFQRLMERLESLSRDFSDTPLVFDDPKGLIAAAGQVRVVENRLRWEELRSYSTRRRAESPTSGLLGEVVLEAEDWSPFLLWLVWGQFTHVGKDAVKGNGWYSVASGQV